MRAVDFTWHVRSAGLSTRGATTAASNHLCEDGRSSLALGGSRSEYYLFDVFRSLLAICGSCSEPNFFEFSRSFLALFKSCAASHHGD